MNRIVCIDRVLRLLRIAAVVAIVALGFGQAARLVGTAGDLDPSFGTGGVAEAPSGQLSCACAVAVHDDGRIVAATPEGDRVRLTRFNADGSLDALFDAASVRAIVGSGAAPIKVLLRPDDRIVVVVGFGGTSSNLNDPVAVVQYNPDGTLDAGFGSAGIARHVRLPAYDYVTDAAMQADGGIVVSGYAVLTGTDVDFTVRRFTASGAIDPTFGPPMGWVNTNLLGVDEAFGITVQPDGRIVVVGFSDAAVGVRRPMTFVRYLADGALDASFGTEGKAFADPSFGLADQSWAFDVLVQPDGRIVAAGYSDLFPIYKGTVVRLLSDGQLDPSFSGDGMATYATADLPAGSGATVGTGFQGVAIQPNGRLLLMTTSDTIIGLRPDGTLDPDFHGDGVARIPGTPWDMTVQTDGKIVIGSGRFGLSGGFRVMRLIADNTPPGLLPVSVSVARGETVRVPLGTAVDTSDPFTNLVVAPIAGTLPAGVTFADFLVDPTNGAVSVLASASCTTATGVFDVQLSITDGGNATTFATVPVEVVTGPPPTLSIGDRTQAELNGVTTAPLVITATGGVCAQIVVEYATANGTATAPSDYTATTGTATIAVGQSSTTISIPLQGDLLGEFDEKFFVTLSSPVNAVIGDGEGAVTIVDDDPPLVQFDGPATLDVVEKDAPSPADVVTLRVVRLTRLNSTSAIQVFLSGSAQNGADYRLLSPQFITFTPGQSRAEIQVAIVGDLVEESTENVTVSIISSGNTTIGTPGSVRITIADDDGPVADPDAPMVVGTMSAAPNAAGWHRADVSVVLSATDGTGSGVESISYSLSGAQPQGLTVVPAASASIPVVTEGITVVTFFAEDAAGNVAASQSLSVRLDKTAPGVVITSPQARAYSLNEAAPADYTCTDGGSGVMSCTGTTAAGAAIDTGSAGAKTYSATATDAAGNTGLATVAYSVVQPLPTFTIRALYDPLREHNSGSAIPIKVQVENAVGVNISASGLAVEALAVSSGTEIGPAEEELLADDAGQSNPLGRFRFVSDDAYLFNLKTTGLKPGPYVLVLRVAGDTALHAVPFLIR